MSGTFMAAEIAGAGEVVARQLAANAEPVAALGAALRACDPHVVVTIARGSSDHAALYLKHLVELRLGLVCASLCSVGRLALSRAAAPRRRASR